MCSCGQRRGAKRPLYKCETNFQENGMNRFKNFMQDQSGATAIEYALIASAMALALVTAMPSLGNIIKNKFVNIGTKITSGTS
jgi:pilus assembly protein Flp/PilA